MCLSLNKRAILAKTDMNEVNSLISEYTPFLHALIVKYTAQGKGYDRNELFSAAQEAFYEAIKHYDENKGYFINFSALVIKRRLLNSIRAQSVRRSREIVFSGMSSEGVDGDMMIYDPEDTQSPPTDNPTRYELEAIKMESLAYGIDFMRLAHYSPKTDKTKKACFSAVHYLKNHDAVLSDLRKTGNLPLKQITEETGIPKKTLERHRQYVIVVTLIAVNDYPYLSEWLGLRQEGGIDR